MHSDKVKAKIRKPYEKPSFCKITPEQARLTLLGHATLGSREANELLSLIFPPFGEEPRDSHSKVTGKQKIENEQILKGNDRKN
jgi:hypothetical protein